MTIEQLIKDAAELQEHYPLHELEAFADRQSRLRELSKEQLVLYIIKLEETTGIQRYH